MGIEKIEPLWEQVVIQKDVVPSSVGKIVLAEQNSLRPQSGVVLKASKQLEAVYPAGTRVVFGQYAGNSITLDGESFTFLHASEIDCVVREA